METGLIFAYGFGYKIPDCDDFIPLIKSRGSKGVNWSELETHLTWENGVNDEDRQNCLGIQQWIDPQKLMCPLSGPLILTTTSYLVHDSIYPFTKQGNAIQFYSLRQVIWQNSNNECWLDLQIKWDVNKFIGILSVLDRYMRPGTAFI